MIESYQDYLLVLNKMNGGWKNCVAIYTTK